MNAESTNPKTPKSPKTHAKSRKAAKPADATTLTLKQLAEGYLRELERTGRSAGTRFSYEMELSLASAQLGAETPISSLTPERLRDYYESDAVTKTRKGRAKAKPTIDRTRRVLRLAFAWAEQSGLLSPAKTEERPASKARGRGKKAAIKSSEVESTASPSPTEPGA